MRDLAEIVAGWIYALRITSGQQWALRLLVLGSGAGVAALCWVWFPILLSTALLVTAALLAAASALRPDSAAALFHAAVVSVWWLAGGASGQWWQWLAVAALVAAFHLATAFAAAAPSYAVITGRAGARMSRAVAGFVAVSVAAGAAAIAVTGLPRSALGLWWVAAGALAVLGATVAVVAALPRSGD